MNRSERMQVFCAGILAWYAVHRRTLPWRDLKERDPNHRAYLVLVSEMMLQQTQVARVIILYKKFILTFPRIEDLANASNGEVLIAWRGLGYNARALRLRNIARIISHDLHGVFPTSMEDLQKLPGIGHYTAGAIRNFAFGIPTPCIDTNIRRILHRFFIGPENPDGTWKKDDAYLLGLAENLLMLVSQRAENKMWRSAGLAGPRAGATPLKGKGWSTEGKPLGFPSVSAAWHSALMDFGSLVCTKNSPKWDLFPNGLKQCCKAYGRDVARTPRAQKKEPGRMMAGKFVPNRIFRGRIIEALRDAKKGLTLDQIGSQIAVDWTMGDHRIWLANVLRSLLCDHMIVKSSTHFRLSE